MAKHSDEPVFLNWLGLREVPYGTPETLRYAHSVGTQGERDKKSSNSSPIMVSDDEVVVSNHTKSKTSINASAHPEERFSERTGLWKKNQPVMHDKFGLGIVQDIELRANGTTILQVKFKSGSKKIDASFIRAQ